VVVQVAGERRFYIQMALAGMDTVVMVPPIEQV
jgi:hypothetical protein